MRSVSGGPLVDGNGSLARPPTKYEVATLPASVPLHTEEPTVARRSSVDVCGATNKRQASGGSRLS